MTTRVPETKVCVVGFQVPAQHKPQNAEIRRDEAQLWQRLTGPRPSGLRAAAPCACLWFSLTQKAEAAFKPLS